MEGEAYRKQIIKTINKLIRARGKLFSLIINMAFANEYKHLQNSFEIGDVYTFTLDQFEGATDLNLANLVKLCQRHDKVIHDLRKYNSIEDDEINDF